MKYLAWSLGVLVTIMVALYVVVFTPLGNSILQPIIETKIKGETKLDSKLNVFSLSMSDLEIHLELNKNNTILVKGSYSLFSKASNLTYEVKLDELKTLKELSGVELRKSFHTSGSAKGDISFMEVNGVSDLASSDTTYHIELTNFNPTSIMAKVKNLKISELLYILKQPHYADGVFSLDADITDARSGKLKGKVVTTLKKGLVDSKYMTKAYEFTTPMPQTTFTMNTDTTLNAEMLDTKIDLNSNLANMDVKRARMNLEDSSVISDYKVKIQNLDKLFFVTEQHMKGAITLNGEVKKNTDLDLTMHSKVAGGKIDAKLHNDDFHADIVSMQTLDILHMLIYPEILKSSLNAKLDYNLATLKGDFKGHLVDGKFAKNQMFGLLKQYAHIDLYREKFKGDVSAKINRENILAALDIKSRKASIKTTNTKLNSKTKRIDSKIEVVADKQPITFTIKGKTANPKVSIDMKQLMDSKAGDSAKKEINRLFKKLF